MAFGGYKFAGYRVDNSQYATSIERCLAIHAARIRAFLDASSLAGGPWVVDPDWMTGELAFDTSTGTITSGVNNGLIHELVGDDSTAHGYSSYFKYSSDGKTGYYFIMTVDNYWIINDSSVSTNGIHLNIETVPRFLSSYYVYYAPFYASCFHCFSEDPFGSDSVGVRDWLYLNTNGQKSTNLKSIGLNYAARQNISNMTSGYVNLSAHKTFFGYAIKDRDIEVFSSYYSTTDYQNPFSLDSNAHCSVLSLEGFSELYNKDDIYKFLDLDIKNSYYQYSGGTYAEQSCNQFVGAYGMILDVNGVPSIFKSSESNSGGLSIYGDGIAAYYSSGANYTPFEGIVIGGKNNGTLYAKGRTNPEFIAFNISYPSLSYSAFSAAIDGSMLYLFNVADANAYGVLRESTSFSGSNNSAYCNFYVGWDPSNPDIKTDAAWPEYNAVIPT